MSPTRRPLLRLVASAAIATCVIGSGVACDPSSPTSKTTTTTTTAPTTATPPTVTPASCRGTGSTAKKNVAYKHAAGVDPNLLSLDLYTPTRPARCGPAPIVVYVHGGGFRIGDKANKVADKVRLFTTEGWVFASVNYRLSPQPPSDSPGLIRYPTHEQDVVAALAWLKSHASTFGGDPKRFFFVGHSSGAFLVSLISTDMSFLAAAGLDSSNVRCTVSLDTEYTVAKQVAQGGSQEQLYRNAFGDDPAIWAKGSPINYTATGVSRPEFLIYTQGVARRTAQARDFASALNRGGTAASLIDVTPLDHEGINRAVGAPNDTKVTPPLMTFLRSCT